MKNYTKVRKDLPVHYRYMDHHYEHCNLSLEHELAQFQWIDVNERLPETDDEFIVCVSGDVVTCEFNPWTCGEGDGSYQWFEWQDVPNYGSEKCLITGVTHWMPLPKPPTNKL